ncbi:MAG: hypothetical protein HQ567_33795 [Candidatus Nealsonbacteria bacterium]|nr:hypothetical protein [Candidatus Nealsonbacteria bacterium]
MQVYGHDWPRVKLVTIISGQTLQEWELGGKKKLPQSRYHFATSKGTPMQINLVPRAYPPEKRRPLSPDEQKYASTGFKGIYRLKGDTLEIYYPSKSLHPRPKSFHTDGRGGTYIRMERIPDHEKPEKREKESPPAVDADEGPGVEQT